MLDVISGRDGFEFVVLTDANVREAISYAADKGEKAFLHLDFSKLSKDSAREVAENERVSSVFSFHIVNGGDGLTGIQNIDNIKNISFAYPDSIFDFSKMFALKSVGGVWSKKWAGLSSCKELAEFKVSSYGNRVSDIPNIGRLEVVSLIGPALADLSGIEVAERLAGLELIRAAKLSDIGNIVACSKSIQFLNFDVCKKVSSFLAVGRLEKLRNLSITDCGGIESIAFVSDLKKLELLNIFGTKVLDGNLEWVSCCSALREFRSENIKNYSPSVAEIKSRIEMRIMGK